MTQPDHGDGDQLPELSPDLWEPLSDDVFSRMLSEAMDPLAAPEDLSDVPDQAEDYPEDYVFDGAADPADFGDGDDDDPGFGIDDADDDDFGDDLDDLDDLDDADTGADDSTGTDAPDADDVDDIDGGDVL